MRAPISVIIPTLNAQDGLPACLGALGEGLAAGLIRELIISDGGSEDATVSIAQSAGADLVKGAPSRGGQIKRGTEQAQGAWLLILHADTVLEPGWANEVQRALAQPGAYHFRLAFDATGLAARWVAGWANLRSRWFGLPYGDQGILIERSVLGDIGGYPDLPLMEDVALARALTGQWQRLSSRAFTSAHKYQTQGWLRRGSRNLMTLSRYLAGADPAELAERYRRQ